MSQTILVEEHPERRKIHSLNFNVFAGTDVVAKDNHREAVSLIKVHPSINLIVCEAGIKNENTALEIWKYLRRSNKNIPMIVLGDCPELADHSDMVVIVDQNVDLDILVDHVLRSLKVTRKEVLDMPMPSLLPIPISYFKDMGQYFCDIYLRIYGKGKEDRFLKRFNRGEEVAQEPLERYAGYGETDLFIQASDREDFVRALTQKVLPGLKNKDLPIDQRMALTEESMNVVILNLDTFGITEEGVVLINACVDSIMKIVAKFPNLKSLFKKLLNNKASFIYKHCQMIAYLCNSIIKTMGWGNFEQAHKLAVAAFFHDLFLEKEELAMVRSQEELDKQLLTPKEKDLVSRHAQMTSDLIKKLPHVPLNVDVIVKQHHGMISGIGFTKEYPTTLSSLATLFIVVEEFVHQLIIHDKKKFIRSKVFREMEKKFRGDHYQKIINALKKVPH